MKVDADLRPQTLALSYLRQIETLTFEIVAGMAAIGENSCSVFGESVAKQQEIVDILCQLAAELSLEEADVSKAGQPLPRRHKADRAVAERIRLAGESLQVVKTRYAALLRHCEESASLFTFLCRSYTGQYEGPAETGKSRQNWSS